MPPIRQIDCSRNALRFVDSRGETKFETKDIPVSADSTGKLDTYLNDVKLPDLVKDPAAIAAYYQMAAHVFSLSPLHLTAWAGNIGEKIPDNWWMDDPDIVK